MLDSSGVQVLSAQTQLLGNQESMNTNQCIKHFFSLPTYYTVVYMTFLQCISHCSSLLPPLRAMTIKIIVFFY